jgi:magnesium-transporting ATPase (P-type)
MIAGQARADTEATARVSGARALRIAGLRVLAVNRRLPGRPPRRETRARALLLGLVGLFDRPAGSRSQSALSRAGIRIIVVTGDW